MDKFDREVQKKILQNLYDIYPDAPNEEEISNLSSYFQTDKVFFANLLYLEQHGLISSGLEDVSCLEDDGPQYGMINYPMITHRGIDFLRDDGGLGAILNVQTVKLHDSTIIALEDIIRVANIPEDQQKGLISKLRELRQTP